MWLVKHDSNMADLSVAVLHRACGMCLLLSIPLHAAEDPTPHEDLMSFSDFYTYNPLKKSQNITMHRGGSNLNALNNTELELLASNSRSQEMNAAQRALNQNWLSQDREGNNVSLGGRALQKILQQGFRTYWDSVRATTFKGSRIVPDSNGRGSLDNGTEYKLKLKDDEVKLALEYSF